MRCHSDINNLIMDYLIKEGYPLAAQKFSTEANIQPRDPELIDERREILDLICCGDLQMAIEKINDLNPQVSKTHISLSSHFHD